MNSLNKIFKDFRKIPKGMHVDDPSELVQTDFTSPINKNIFFTRRSLKHIAEKTNGIYIFRVIPLILKEPDSIHIGSKISRLLYSKRMLAETNIKPHIVCLEIRGANDLVIVTAFIAKQKYLKDFKILWRTASPPSAYPQ